MNILTSHSSTRIGSATHHLPFLYFRSIVRDSPLRSAAIIRSLHDGANTQQTGRDDVTTRLAESRTETYTTEEKKRNFVKSRGLESLRKQSPSPIVPTIKSTITGKEKAIFKRIFKEISSGGEKDPVKSSQPVHSDPLDHRHILALFSDAPTSEDFLQANAGKDEKDGPQRWKILREARASSTLSSEDRNNIQKYPQRLQSIAWRATLLSKVDPKPPGGHIDTVQRDGQKSKGQPKEMHTDKSKDENETIEAGVADKRTVDMTSAAEEMKRISEVLVAAAAVSDKELWMACNAHVFSLFETLKHTSGNDDGLFEPPPKRAKGKKKINKKTIHSSEVPSPTTSPPPPPKPEPHHSLPTLSTLLPALILLSQRLLTKSYPLSSYTSLILPHLRSLGLKPYLLGTSTPFFNSLLRHRWTVYSDLAGMETLLAEMESGGVEFDMETVEVLEMVRGHWFEDHQEAVEQEKGAGTSTGTTSRRDRRWWASLLESGTFESVVGNQGWRGKVMERVREQEDYKTGANAVVEREYAQSLGVGEQPLTEDSGRQVWIG